MQPLDGQTLKWAWPRDLRNYPMPPAPDTPLIPHLVGVLA